MAKKDTGVYQLEDGCWGYRFTRTIDGKKKDVKPKKKKNAASNMDSGTMNLISGLTVLRFTSMLGMRNVYFTKEELLKLNKQLNKIKKITK